MVVPVATTVVVPSAIFAGCLVVGVLVATRFLPELPPDIGSGLVFVLVCGMIGAAAALVGLHVYEFVEESSERFGLFASIPLEDMLWQVALVLGLATIAYMLAWRPEDAATRD
jgi:hypothetical protein